MTTETPKNDTPTCSHSRWCSGLMWWFWLFFAVLVVPFIGSIIALTVAPNSTIGQMVIFVLACWISVWLGMGLMRKSHHFHFPHHHQK